MDNKTLNDLRVKRARIRIEIKKGLIFFTKVTDIESGLVIPIIDLKIEGGIGTDKREIFATLTVLVEEVLVEGLYIDDVREVIAKGVGFDESPKT